MKRLGASGVPSASAVARGIAICSIGWLVACAARPNQSGDAQPGDSTRDWAVESGLALEVDTEGYDLPTAIAFVPDPGPRPEDPLYFVAELRGTIKVVTRSRAVLTFAKNLPTSIPTQEMPHVQGETGMAGLCLDAAHGYVFATMAYADSKGALRNGVVRLQTVPGTLGAKPTSQLFISAPFARDTSAISHQIGSCQVAGDKLFVSVGDARQTNSSHDLNSSLGKVLRMSLEGKAPADNPFYDPADPEATRSFVWASGFRNPFGLKRIGDHLLVGDNGLEVDRLVDVARGSNYLWNGTDHSIATNSLAVFTDAIGPVQMDFLGSSAAFAGQDRNSLFIAASSDPPGIVEVGYDPATNRINREPREIVRFDGKLKEGRQQVAGVGVGPDGVYFVPVVPDTAGRSAVFKIRYDPMHAHPAIIRTGANPVQIMRARGCYGCHKLDGQGGTAGPDLDREALVKRLRARLNTTEYERAVVQLGKRTDEPFRATRPAREKVLRATGEDRVREWLKYHIMEPRFDNPNSLMPNVGATYSEASAISEFLMPRSLSPQERAKELAKKFVPTSQRWRLALAFALGALVGGLAALSLLRGRPSASSMKRSRGPKPQTTG